MTFNLRRKLANLVCLDKEIGISERGQTYLPFYVWNECTRSLQLKFSIIQDKIWVFKMMFFLTIFFVEVQWTVIPNVRC